MELTHGGDLFGCPADTIDFSANTNLLGMPERVKQALSETVALWGQYPDPLCRVLRAELSARELLPREWIHCGNGAADLIFRLVFALRPKRALLLAPTFSEYEQALRAVGCEIGFHPLYEKDEFAVTDKLLNQLSPALNLLVLCNPNNPTGQPIDQTLLLRIVKRCEACGIYLLVDECFLPFLEDGVQRTLKEHLEQAKHLLILQAFTKLYAMAGLRLGYLLCADSGLLERVAACGQAWNVSMPAQIAGVAALADLAYLEETAWRVGSGRAWLTERLKCLGVQVIGSKANFVFFKCNQHRDLRERLLEKGILIRSCANFRGLDARFYRVAVRDEQKNERLIEALRAVL